MSSPVAPQNNPVYTNLGQLQNIKTEKNADEALKQVAREFESIFVNLMLKNMRSANEVFSEGGLFDSQQTKFYRDMYDQQLALSMSHGNGVGIAETLYRQLKGSYGDRVEQQTATPNPLAPQAEHSDWRRVKASGQTAVANATQPAASDPHETASQPVANPVEAPKTFQSAREFIDNVLPAAKDIAARMGLNPLLMVAQAALETGWGQHIISDKNGNSSNNLFNIKASHDWTGPRIAVDTLEYRENLPVKEQALFRHYDSIAESIADFVDFLRDNPRYQQALAVKDDPGAFMGELQSAGYATDPAYADKVMSVYKRLRAESPAAGGH